MSPICVIPPSSKSRLQLRNSNIPPRTQQKVEHTVNSHQHWPVPAPATVCLKGIMSAFVKCFVYICHGQGPIQHVICLCCTEPLEFKGYVLDLFANAPTLCELSLCEFGKIGEGSVPPLWTSHCCVLCQSRSNFDPPSLPPAALFRDWQEERPCRRSLVVHQHWGSASPPGAHRASFWAHSPAMTVFNSLPASPHLYPHQTIHALNGPLSWGYGLIIQKLLGPLELRIWTHNPLWSTWGASLWVGKSGVKVGIVNTKVAHQGNSVGH